MPQRTIPVRPIPAGRIEVLVETYNRPGGLSLPTVSRASAAEHGMAVEVCVWLEQSFLGRADSYRIYLNGELAGTFPCLHRGGEQTFVIRSLGTRDAVLIDGARDRRMDLDSGTDSIGAAEEKAVERVITALWRWRDEWLRLWLSGNLPRLYRRVMAAKTHRGKIRIIRRAGLRLFFREDDPFAFGLKRRQVLVETRMPGAPEVPRGN